MDNPPPQPSPDILRPGDSLKIVYHDVPSQYAPTEEQVQIREDGSIILHLNQRFQAAGKTASALEADIRDRYVGQFYQRMTPAVTVADRVFTVFGEVRAPGRYPYYGEVTVLRAIAAAGGFTDFASQKKVEILRADGEPVTVNCVEARERGRDVPIYPGDAVFVPLSPL